MSQLDVLKRPLAWPARYPLPSMLRSGLVGWWPFDQRSGKILRDRSGKRNNGTITGATWVPNGLSLDGTGDYITVTHVTGGSLDLTSPLSLLVQFSTTTTAEQSLIAKRTDATQDWYEIEMANNIIYFFFDNAGSTDYISKSSAGYNDGLKHTVLATHSGTHAIIYLDGKLVAEKDTTVSIPKNTKDLYIGARDSTSILFTGKIYQAMMFNRTPNATEAKRLYEMTKSYVMGG